MLLARAPIRFRLHLRTSNFSRRWQTTLEQNPHIYVYPHPKAPAGTTLLTLLSTRDPPTADLAIASTTALPPTPATVTENPHFLRVLQTVVAANATADPAVQAQAQAFASSGGSALGSGGMFFKDQRQQNSQARRRAVGGGGGAGGGGAGGASAQGGAGGAGVGGFVHVADQRNPPDWGRIPYSEDILGSVQVDGSGQFVGEHGEYQSSGTYRAVTREGILNLSPFLREKLVERLKELEKEIT